MAEFQYSKTSFSDFFLFFVFMFVSLSGIAEPSAYRRIRTDVFPDSDRRQQAAYYRFYYGVCDFFFFFILSVNDFSTGRLSLSLSPIKKRQKTILRRVSGGRFSVSQPFVERNRQSINCINVEI